MEAWCCATDRLGVHLVAGIAESDDGKLYNSAVVIGPDRLIGHDRKMHLWDAEALPVDRVGTERGQEFIGRSLIVNHSGWPVSGPACEDQEELLLAKVNLADARRKRSLNAFNQISRDRRIDYYVEIIGGKQPAGRD